jgi:DNA-binding GntR family transcriptional regulator
LAAWRDKGRPIGGLWAGGGTVSKGNEAPNRSLAEAAHSLLEEMIVTLQLKPGSLWSEEALSERIAIGRTPVREAAKRLQADSRVRILPRHGLQIAEIDLHEQLQVVDLRARPRSS